MNGDAGIGTEFDRAAERERLRAALASTPHVAYSPWIDRRGGSAVGAGVYSCADTS